jgi:hypothetical protein
VSSSSIIKFIIEGPTGNIGSTGNTGATGNTGSRGLTGATGPYGLYFVSASASGNSIILTYSDGTTAQINGSFKGATTADKSTGIVLGGNTGGTGFFYNVSGGTLNFFGLSAYGSLRASYAGANNEYISIDSIYYGADVIGNYDPSTLVAREVLYVGNTTTVHGANLKHRSDVGTAGLCGAFDFTFTEYNAGASADTSIHLNAGAKIYSYGPIPRNSEFAGSTFGVLIDADNGGVFNLRTPIGVRGITGSFKINEVASLTLVIDSDNVWNFPSNIYFSTDENYLSCGKNIIGLISYDAGNTWLATVSHRGHGIENVSRQCVPGALYGSCCYRKADGTRNCRDYVSKEDCNKLFGVFYPAQPCSDTCGTLNSVCCANGQCIEGVSVTECEQYGGDYWEGVTCGYATGTSNYPNPTLYTTPEQIKEQGRFCYDKCGDVQTVCCKDGRCLGNYTRVQCELLLGGTSLVGSTCGDVDCCTYDTIPGACCICTTDGQGVVTSTCNPNTTYSDCKTLGGYFMGPGKQCNEVSCDCVCTDVTGGGNQGGGGGNDGPGLCCKNGACLNGVTTKQACDAQCGNWLGTVQFLTSEFQGAAYDIKTYTFGSNEDDCEFCALTRPVVKLIDQGSCFPTWSVEKMPMDSNSDLCCSPTVPGWSSNTCTDILNAGFARLVGSSAVTVRDQLLEILTCPQTPASVESLNITLPLVYAYWIEEGVSIAGDCEYNSCCDCNVTYTNCIPSTRYPSFAEFCAYEYCPSGKIAANAGTDCSGGLGSAGGFGGTTPGSNNCGDVASEYCTAATYACTCVQFAQTSTIKNMKVVINNQEFCIPISCDENCDGLELCE